ncbi:MAG: hypothetical protein KDA24_16605, partial [Deltaproteobacteria bacterium]|nr:hypothetical protein [Deltaproteobacteria bacterium]
DDDDSAGDDDDSAGDDDDSGPDPLVMDLTYMDVYCEATGADDGEYIFTTEFTGYAENVWFFMWDGFTFDDAHFQDSTQPWELSNLDYSAEDSQWDIYGLGGGGDDAFGDPVPDVGIYGVIADAEAANGTILDCYDDNSQPNVEVHNYMVCATDFNDETNAQCYFCGEDLGEDVFWMGSLADNNDYQVGLWTDPTDDTVVYQVTSEVTNDPDACTLSSTLLTR